MRCGNDKDGMVCELDAGHDGLHKVGDETKRALMWSETGTVVSAYAFEHEVILGDVLRDAAEDEFGVEAPKQRGPVTMATVDQLDAGGLHDIADIARKYAVDRPRWWHRFTRRNRVRG